MTDVVGQEHDCHNDNVLFSNSAAVSMEGPSVTCFGLGFSVEKVTTIAHCSFPGVYENFLAPMNQKAQAVPTDGVGGFSQEGLLHETVFVAGRSTLFPKSHLLKLEATSSGCWGMPPSL